MLGRYDIEDDAARAFAVLKDGGIAILPEDDGYYLIGGPAGAPDVTFRPKGQAIERVNPIDGTQAKK